MMVLAALHSLFLWALPPSLGAQQALSPLTMVSPADVILVADASGRILYDKNASVKSVPASTLKVLTALAAMHYLGPSFRFQTEFYLDDAKNLIIKGYGDPLLISEVWWDIAQALASRLTQCHHVLVDDSYFFRHIQIPGSSTSTNPYDAPVGALSANFNTIFFQKDQTGRIVSAEPQTPMTPLARRKAQRLGLNKGRYSLTHNGDEISRYAGEICMHFLKKNGLNCTGRVQFGTVKSQDRPFYVYTSHFTLEEAVQKMLMFSNNFMANQLLLALGARTSGPPGTLEKGVRILCRFASEVLGLKDIHIAEGSGISRENRLSAHDMLVVLEAFAPYRNLLRRDGNVLYKSGSLRGLKARAGYIEQPLGKPYRFVVFLKRTFPIKTVINALVTQLAERTPQGIHTF
jgi:D-alanyl-D-alanine carboxypeptidase/D-alanyl-D-alanine-endopeptidase (penicillin-binding protein 4)